MQYFASHYWQNGERNTTSLVLQQAYHKRKRMPVLLAGIEENEKLLSQRLTEWFYGTGLSLCSRNGEKGFWAISCNMVEFLNQVQYAGREKQSYSFAGILCVGSSFLLFQRGMQRICLLNTRNHRSNCQEMNIGKEASRHFFYQRGGMQRGLGILLATEHFHQSVSPHMITECLNVRELRSQNQVDRRLRELGGYAEQHGGTGIGAVLIVTR